MAKDVARDNNNSLSLQLILMHALPIHTLKRGPLTPANSVCLTNIQGRAHNRNSPELRIGSGPAPLPSSLVLRAEDR